MKKLYTDRNNCGECWKCYDKVAYGNYSKFVILEKMRAKHYDRYKFVDITQTDCSKDYVELEVKRATPLNVWQRFKNWIKEHNKNVRCLDGRQQNS